MKQTKNLLLSYTLYFRLLPLLFGIGGVLLPLLSPHLFEKEIALDRLDITHFVLPFWIFISLAGALILYQFLAEVQAKTGKETRLNEEGTLLFWSLGYANLLFGVINSHLGILFFFILGAITNCIPYFRNGFKGLLRPKLFLIATTAYVAYEALTLLWSDNALQSLTYWQKEIWIAIVPLLMCIAPPSGYTVRRFMKYALQISYLYLLSQLLIYGWTCLSIENPLWAAFSFNKAYFTISGEAMFPGFLLSLLGFDHYTYLGFVFLAPILYFLTEHILKSSNRHSWEIISLVSFAAISYSFIHQSRTLMLFYLFIALIVIVRKKNGWGYKRVVASSIVGLGVILGVLLYFYPHLLHFFVDTHRLELLRVARNYLGDNLLNGYGLGSSENLIYPFFNGAKHTAHFHNQFIQSLLEGGVVSGLLVALIPISYGIESYRQKNGASLFLILLFSLIMVIDLVVFLTEYLIAMLLLLSIMIHGTSTKATE